MSSSTLVAHSPKFDAKLVSRTHLATLPEPLALGSRHKPIPHHVLVDSLLAEIESRNFVPVREQYALAANGGALFGVIDLQSTSDLALTTAGERGISFGFRSSTDSSLAAQGVAGSRVFVCDNLSMSGSMITFKRKSTTQLDLRAMVASGVDKFITHTETMDVQIEVLQQRQLTDGSAKEQIFDIFNSGIVPVRLFDDVARFYFKPADEMTDCTPRNAWGLHNAFTRAMRDLTPVRLFNASVALGRAFRLGEVVEGEIVTETITEVVAEYQS